MEKIGLDEKIEKIDLLYSQVEKLWKDYENYCQQGFQEDGRDICLKDIYNFRYCGHGTVMETEEISDALERMLWEKQQPQICDQIGEILLKLQQNIKKLYLSYIHDEGSYRKVKLENYYGTSFSKNALIVYIVYPFLFQDITPGHTNQREVKILAQLLQKRGYNVDIINTKYEKEVEIEKYDFVIGSGKCFERICMNKRQNSLAVYYLTESSPYFSNIAELRRLKAFEKRNGKRVSFERQSHNFLDLEALSKADAAICIGNEQTVSTYDGMFQRIYPLRASGFEPAFVPEFGNSNFTGVRNNFMWYGGTGPVHKGLDLCIEAFRELPDLNLHIVGEVNREFYDFYKEDIEHGKNIYYYGFLAKDSEEFQNACMQCGFCLSPSCSEGQSTSVLTAMFAGMIPVCTLQTGISLDECSGVLISKLEVDEMIRLCRELSTMDITEINRRRQRAYEYVCRYHTLENYEQELGRLLDTIIGDGGCEG